MGKKIAMGFDERLIVTEDDSAEFVKFGLVYFDLGKWEVVMIFGVEIRYCERTESGCAGCSHEDFINNFLLFNSLFHPIINSEKFSLFRVDDPTDSKNIEIRPKHTSHLTYFMHESKNHSSKL